MPADTTASVMPTEEDATLIYCKKCGAANDETAQQCALCGVALREQPQQPLGGQPLGGQALGGQPLGGPPPQPPYGQPQQPSYPQQPPYPQQPQYPPPGYGPGPQPYGQQPGRPYGYQYGPQAPVPGPSLTGTIILSIFAMLCCGCWPAGLVSLIYAIQANSKSVQGFAAEAADLEGKAKAWAYGTIVIGVIVSIIYGVVIASGALHPQSTYGPPMRSF